MTGCGTTETIVKTEIVPAIPPSYLWDSERLPQVPEGVPPEERTDYLLESYASRGDVIKRDQKQEERMRAWEEAIKRLYPNALAHPFPEAEEAANDPEGTGSE